MKTPIMTPGAEGMDLIFREVRSQNGWQASRPATSIYASSAN